MVTFDDNLLSEEGLDDIDNESEVNDSVSESNSDNEEMKKLLKIGKKEVDEFNGRTNVWILWKPFVKMNIFEENPSS